MKVSSWFFALAAIVFLSCAFPPSRVALAGQKAGVSKSIPASSKSNTGFRRSRSFDQLVGSTVLVAPLGINPLMALAGFGVAAYWGHWSPPGGLEFIASPWIWGSFLLFGFLMQFGRSFKLTKPLAELLGTGESLLAIASIGLAMLPAAMINSGNVQQAGMLTNIGLMAFGLLSLGAVMILRAAFDFLIWISPFPFVDGLFQFIKLGLTAILILLAVMFPWAAFIVNIAIIVAALFMLRWAIRLSIFAGIITSDLTWRKMWNVTESLPLDSVESADLGPILVFAEKVKGRPKRARLHLSLINGRWMLAAYGKEENFTPLGEGKDLTFSETILGYSLGNPESRVFLPPRYKGLISEFSRRSGSGIDAQESGLAGGVRAVLS